jgi:gliding motility-associated-like protein
MSYENGACLTNNSKVLVVHAAPVVNITAPNNDFSICEGESIELGVSGIFNSYNWNTGESTPTITASEERNYIVNITNSFGCEVTASKNVTVTPAPEVIITATPASVLEGESSQLQASGLDNYSWDPDPTLSDLNISNPIATPLQTTLYKVQGLDGNGCAGEAFIEVILKSGSPSSKLSPSNFFSPSNGDEINKYWTVERIEEFPECGIFIYDDKGVQVFQAKPYLNDWDGTFNGKQLPDGVYYFIIKCEGDSNPPKAGSITILR